jgi:hypothetical protein
MGNHQVFYEFYKKGILSASGTTLSKSVVPLAKKLDSL